jgi:Tfp pilus assembly protein PilZ
MTKERRKDIRIPLLRESITWTRHGKLFNLKTDKVTDMSVNGMFIESEVQPDIGEVVQIFVKLPGELGALDLSAKVKWRRWATSKKNPRPIGFGVNIGYDNPKIEKIMSSYLVYMRNKQIIEVSKRIVEEYFGRSKPIDKGPTV